MQSMTGYGASEFSIGDGRFSVEIKSVNHRFLEINIRNPDRFSFLENKMRDAVKQSCSRGCFYISIASAGGYAGAVKANIPLAENYLDALRELQKALGLKQEIDISLLLKFKDIFFSGEPEHDLERDWAGLKSGLGAALTSLLKMRREEGDVLAQDIAARLDCVKGIVAKMEARVPVISEAYREKLKQRMANILGGADIDEARLLTEVALFAEKSNITEELIRLGSHVTQFKDMLGLGEPVGRKMDFLCQEILREINTIGSKANDFALASLVVSAKTELEKIREQVQNVE